MKRCSIGGCRERAWAAGECLEHYVAHRHDITMAKALAIRSARGSTHEVAQAYGVSWRRAWEIRGNRWWKFIQ